MVGTILGPSDGQLQDDKSQPTHTNFGGNREYTPSVPKKEGDYLSPTGGHVNSEKNPVDETTKDIDDMNDPVARKRETTRRRNTSELAFRQTVEFGQTDDVETLPPEETDPYDGGGFTHRRSAFKYHFGFEGENF